jgi:hypothetical protein
MAKKQPREMRQAFEDALEESDGDSDEGGEIEF